MLSASEVINRFGPPLSPEAISEANKFPSKNQGVRTHQYKAFNFVVDDRVFKPSKTGQILHDMLYQSDLTDKSVIIMGTGCGVEAVVCGYRNAEKFFACDIHESSVKCASENYHRNIETAASKTQAHFITSNLFDEIPAGEQVDLICFDPPAVKVQFSDDPEVIRCSCSGAQILDNFFSQIAEKSLLKEGGTVSIVISNTSDQEHIVRTAYDKGFFVKAAQKHTWAPPYQDVNTFRLDFGLAHKFSADSATAKPSQDDSQRNASRADYV